MVGWRHQLDGHEFEQTLGVGDGQGGLTCCSPWGHKELDTIEQLNKNNKRNLALEPLFLLKVENLFLPIQDNWLFSASKPCPPGITAPRVAEVIGGCPGACPCPPSLCVASVTPAGPPGPARGVRPGPLGALQRGLLDDWRPQPQLGEAGRHCFALQSPDLSKVSTSPPVSRGSLQVRIPEHWGTSQGPCLKTQVLSSAHCPLLRRGGAVSIAPPPGRPTQRMVLDMCSLDQPKQHPTPEAGALEARPRLQGPLWFQCPGPRLQLLTVETRSEERPRVQRLGLCLSQPKAWL